MSAVISKKIDSIRELGGINSRDLAQLLSTTPETVSRWRGGKTEPQPDSRDSLLRLEYLINELSELYNPKEAKLWIYSPNSLLDGKRPLELIHGGDIELVLDVIAQLKDGAFI